jgi:hypothetical protein
MSSTTSVVVGVETADVLVRKPYDSTEAMEFIGRTNQAVFAAAADWCRPREGKMIIRSVTYAASALTDELDCGLTIIFEPI